MAQQEKGAVIDQVREDLDNSAAVLLTDYRGLTVKELAELRAELRKAGATYRVVKNTLARRAVKDAGMEGLDGYLVGPTALAFCSEDPVGPAKAIKAFAKDHPALLFKAGFLDGAALDAEAALKLADLASREELLTEMAGLMYGALANTARLLQAPLAGMARVMGQLEEKGGAPGAPTGDAPATEAPEADATETTEEPEAATEDAPAAEATEEAPAAEAADEATDSADETAATDETPAEADASEGGDDETADA